MRTSKANQDEEEYDDGEFMSKKEGNSNNSTNNTKDGKNNDKASAIRSKHSVTEQRRRSKINERFQILRDLIPHSDQKRDTTSLLLEVIDYVQFLQEKVLKHEGTYQDWGSEATKLMPWTAAELKKRGENCTKELDFNLEEQAKVIVTTRSNNELDASKLKEIPELLSIKESLIKCYASV